MAARSSSGAAFWVAYPGCPGGGDRVQSGVPRRHARNAQRDTGARYMPDWDSSPAGGDGPTVTHPGTSFALNTWPRGPAGSASGASSCTRPCYPSWGRLLGTGSAHTRGVRLILVQMLRLQQFSIHLRIRPFLRRDINLLMKLLKLSIIERHEMFNKYKLINFDLSKIYEFGQRQTN